MVNLCTNETFSEIIHHDYNLTAMNTSTKKLNALAFIKTELSKLLTEKHKESEPRLTKTRV